jgi:hypothetical protein
MPFGHPTSDGDAVARGKGRKRTASGSVSPEMIDHPAVSACAHINAAMHTACTHSLACSCSHNSSISACSGMRVANLGVACPTHAFLRTGNGTIVPCSRPTAAFCLVSWLLNQCVRRNSTRIRGACNLDVCLVLRAQLKLPPAFARRELIITCTLEVQAAAAARQRQICSTPLVQHVVICVPTHHPPIHTHTHPPTRTPTHTQHPPTSDASRNAAKRIFWIYHAPIDGDV